MKMWNNIQSFRDELDSVGLETSTIHSVHPNSPSSLDGGEVARDEATLFNKLITEEEILSVARDVFLSGFYNIAVSESYKSVDNFISKKAKLSKQSGTAMMEVVFSPGKPKLKWSEQKTKSEEDEQKGYHRIFAGAMLGIRNPTTHEFDWISDPVTALELIVFAQHLLRKAKASY